MDAAQTPPVVEKLIVVAGVGEKGVGEHVAKRFASEGYKVAMLARRKENLDALAAEIPGSRGFVCDVSVTDQINSTIKDIEQQMGAIDVLIFNTSYGPFKDFDECSQEDFNLSLATGPAALFAFAKAVTPAMIERGSGVIAVTGATAAWRGMPGTSVKAAGNFGMRALAQSLARSMGPKGIHVFHVIIDALIDQPRTHKWAPEKPAEEFMDPAAIAETYFHMANQPRTCWGFEVNLTTSPGCSSMATI